MEAQAYKYMSCGSTRVEGTHVEQNTHALIALIHKNLLTKSIVLHYANILLADQHNVTYRLFSSAYKILINFLVMHIFE